MTKQPSTYHDWVRVTAKGCLLSWRNLRTLWPDVVEPFRDLMLALWLVLLALLLPLLTPFAPIIALLMRREYRLAQGAATEAVKKWREGLENDA